MRGKNQPTEDLTDNLAEGIAAVMAAEEQLDEVGDMADLFLDELNRLWAEPLADQPV